MCSSCCSRYHHVRELSELHRWFVAGSSSTLAYLPSGLSAAFSQAASQGSLQNPPDGSVLEAQDTPGMHKTYASTTAAVTDNFFDSSAAQAEVCYLLLFE